MNFASKARPWLLLQKDKKTNKIAIICGTTNQQRRTAPQTTTVSCRWRCNKTSAIRMTCRQEPKQMTRTCWQIHHLVYSYVYLFIYNKSQGKLYEYHMYWHKVIPLLPLPRLYKKLGSLWLYGFRQVPRTKILTNRENANIWLYIF